MSVRDLARVETLERTDNVITDRKLARVKTFHPETNRGRIRTLLESPPDRVVGYIDKSYVNEIWYWRMTSAEVVTLQTLLNHGKLLYSMDTHSSRMPIQFQEVMSNSQYRQTAAKFFKKACAVFVDRKQVELIRIERQQWGDIKTRKFRSAVGEYLDLCLQYNKQKQQSIRNAYPESQISYGRS